MNQLLEEQEERPLWADVAHSSTDEINGDSVTKSWGVRECLIVAVFFVMFFVIFRKKERDPDEEDESSRQPAETVVSTTVDKKVLEEEKREMILNLFQSQKNQQEITIDHLPARSTTKSCSTVDTTTSSTSGESQETIDCQRCGDDSDLSFDEEEGLGVLVLSNISNVQNDDDDNHPRSVSNFCAICLEEYHEGETIVWSSNKKCQHAFHRDCLLNYLVKVKAENEFPCPCCRRNFFESTQDEEEEEENEGNDQ